MAEEIDQLKTIQQQIRILSDNIPLKTTVNRKLEEIEKGLALLGRRIEDLTKALEDLRETIVAKDVYPPEIDAEINNEWYPSKFKDDDGTVPDYAYCDKKPVLTAELRKAGGTLTLGGYVFRLSKNGKSITRRPV